MLKEQYYPINQAIHYAGTHTVHDDGACYCKHLSTDSENEPFRFELHGGGGDGIGEACDGHQGAGPGEFGDIIVQAQSRQQRRNGNQCHGAGGACGFFAKAQTLIPVQKELPHAADQSADQKGEKTVLGDGRIWRMALDQRIVLFCVHVRSLQRQFAPFGEKYEQKTEEYLTGCLEMQTFVAYNGGRGEKNEGRGTF